MAKTDTTVRQIVDNTKRVKVLGYLRKATAVAINKFISELG